MLLLNNTFGESAGFGEVGMERLTDEYSQAASGGIVLNYLFFCLCASWALSALPLAMMAQLRCSFAWRYAQWLVQHG